MTTNVDNMTLDGANKLAAKIKLYWKNRGVHIKTELIRMSVKDIRGKDMGAFFWVRSNLNAAYPSNMT